MQAGNSADRYGWLSRLIHWAMAAGMIAALWLGLEIAGTQIRLSTLWMFSWHKTLGIALLAAALLRVLWHLRSPPPPTRPEGMAEWQLRLGRIVHRLFYLLMLAVPLVGWVASAATGPDVVVFGIALPRIAPTSPALAAGAFALHKWLAYALIATLTLHVAGALHRAIWLKDGTLGRILLSR